MTKIEACWRAALALLVAGAMAEAHEAHAKITVNGANLNGMNLQGTTYQGMGTQGSNPSSRQAEATDLGALALRAIHLPDGRVLSAGR